MADDVVDKMLLSWEPPPSLSEAISALVQSLARALAATTDPGASLATVKDGLESILTEILQQARKLLPGSVSLLKTSSEPECWRIVPVGHRLCQ